MQARLKSLAIKAEIHCVEIPDGKTEQEIWDIFQTLIDRVEPQDEIVFDMTHAFRSIPMLAMVTLNYAKRMWHTRVSSISYGAMEVLGSFTDVRELPVEQRNIPIFNLQTFDLLLDWSVAIDRFNTSGDSAYLRELSEHQVLPLIINNDKNKAIAVSIKQTMATLDNLTQNLTTCRSQNIQESALKVQTNLDKIDRNQLIKPLTPVLDKLRQIVTPLSEQNPVKSGIEAAKWCMTHNLVQQSYTILQETCITAVLRCCGLDHNNQINRTLVNEAGKTLTLRSSWTKSMKGNQSGSQVLLGYLSKKKAITQLLEELADLRNDINHAGYRKNLQKPGRLFSKLEHFIHKAENEFLNEKQ